MHVLKTLRAGMLVSTPVRFAMKLFLEGGVGQLQFVAFLLESGSASFSGLSPMAHNRDLAVYPRVLRLGETR